MLPGCQGVVILHIVVVNTNMQDHPPVRDLTTIYLGNIAIEKRYEQHSYMFAYVMGYVASIQSGQLFWWPQSTHWKPQVRLHLH